MKIIALLNFIYWYISTY